MKNPIKLKFNSIPLAIIIIFILTCISCLLYLISKGIILDDDSLRHVAKVVSGKSWDEVLVLRENFDGRQDTHPGWHALLAVFKRLGLNKDELICVSIAIPWLFIFIVFLIFLKRPECFIIALCPFFLIEPDVPFRFFLGRPFLISMGITFMYLFLWNPYETKMHTGLLCFVTVILSAFEFWVHPSWYLQALPISAIFISGILDKKIKIPAYFLFSVIAGISIGSLLFEHPVSNFVNNFYMIKWSIIDKKTTDFIVPEFHSIDNYKDTTIILMFLLLGRLIINPWPGIDWRHPSVIYTISVVFLGFFVRRFWFDWGIAGVLVWISLELECLLKIKISSVHLSRLFTTVCAAVLLFLSVVNLEKYIGYEKTFSEISLVEKNYMNDYSWFPDDGGIVYSNAMNTFYVMFYVLPEKNWRYIIGFEQGLMPKADKEIFQSIVQNPLDMSKYSKWIDKMHPQDRLVIHDEQLNKSMLEKDPTMSRLEWKPITKSKFIGRLKRNNN